MYKTRMIFLLQVLNREIWVLLALDTLGVCSAPMELLHKHVLSSEDITVIQCAFGIYMFM